MPGMALLNPTFVFGLIVLLYLSSFVLLAVLRILTGISIQRIGYLSLRRLAYTPRDGCRIEIRGFGLNVHRPTFAQPTWLSLVLSELVVTLDIPELEGNKPAESDAEASDTDTGKKKKGFDAKSRPSLHSRSSRRGANSIIRSETWKKLTNVKEKIKRLHRNIKWLKLIDVVATNSTINVVDVGNIQVGSFTLSVDTRPKMVDRARFFVQGKHSPSKDRQAEWTMTVRSVLFTAEGNESMELLDHLFLNIHGFLYKSWEGLRDAALSLKLGRLHVPLDDMQTCLDKLKQLRKDPKSPTADDPIDIFLGKVVQEVEEPGSQNEDTQRTVSDSKELFSSILRGIKEVQFAVSFLGLSTKVQPVKPGAGPILLNVAMKEVGIDLHKLDPKSPAHRMYFPPDAIAHEALGATLSISVGLDDGHGQSDRLIYIPMATTTVKTTFLSKTVEVLQDSSVEGRNANILFANSVVTSPSVDLDPHHLPLLISLLKSKPKAQKAQKENHHLISRLLPKATVKFSMHEPVVRIRLKPLQKTEDPDDFDLIISSISSISLDMEASHSLIEDLHYSLDGAVRLQSHNLYYQTNTGDRFNLITTESFDMKLHLGARPDVYVEMTGNIQSASVSMVRPEITDGLRQIVRELRLDGEPDKSTVVKASRDKNFLRSAPSWLLRYQVDVTDFNIEIAGIDEDISDDTRGVFLHWDNASAEYRAHRLDGLQRRASRRRANSRSMNQSDSDFTPPTTSPRPKKKPQNIGDGRRLTIYARGIEAQIMDEIDRLEPEPFISIPRLELLMSAASDSRGPIFNVQVTVRTILAQYSLYRHYAVGVAVMTLRKAFMQTSRDLPQHNQDNSTEGMSPPSSRLAPPGSHQDLSGAPTTDSPEMVTFEFKAALVQLKAEMPHDPSMMLHMYGLEIGRQRWSTPYIAAKLVRLYTEPPRMRNVWARLISVKSGRLDFRESRRKSPHGAVIEEKMIDIVTEAVRIGVPHEVILSRVSDNFINVIKAVQQLHHRFKTGTNEYILEKKPEGPKVVPKVSVRSRNFLFELEDGAFEWKLGMIYRTGLNEQVQRIAREEAFRVKLKRVREEEIRRGSSKLRARSTFPRGRPEAPSSSSFRSRSLDAMGGTDGHSNAHRGRVPRYDPESENFGVNGSSKVSEYDARYHLDVFNCQSWKKRIDKAYEVDQAAVREARKQFWGPSQLPDDIEEAENLLEVPPRPALMSTLISDLHFTLDKPTFPMKDLPDFLHKIGKGMPRDMQYSLLVPTHVGIEMGEAKVTLRDYPLPLLHIPPMKYGQSPKLQSVSLKSNFVIAEEFRGVESTRRVRVNVIPPRNADPTSKEGGFVIEVRRTIGPVKSYSDVYMDVNTALPTRITWGPCYQPAVQDMMMVIESFTKPQFDPSERVGFWDKLRLNFHSKIHAAWKGDGDMHLALKGTRDPYQVTGNGAGFLMCWRNDVKWSVNAEDDPKRFIAIESSEYVLAIPDYSHEVREAARLQTELERHTPDDKFKSEATFKKVVMKLSGKVQFLVGLIFERAIVNGRRSFDFRPHYDIVLKNPHWAKDEGGIPYDAMRGFRSRHIHLSIAVRAPVDRDWLSENPEPSRSYNTVHLTPRFFTHFFAWWGLFGQPLSLPIRQGSLFPGREKNSKKFGRHLATVKYNLLLAPLFLSHIYKHKDVEDYSENAVSATGVKVRFDSFSLDLHQRREEFNTLGKGRHTETARTSGIKIHAAQLDLVSADVRAVSASLKGTTTEAIKKGSIATLMSDSEDKPDLSRFTIPDNDFSWIDMDDFVELDWILPTEPHPDTKILPLVYAPRLTYFRQTDIGGVIAGDPTRSSPFGDEPTHFCILNHDNDPIRVQGQLIQERLDQLGVQMQTHARDVGEAELKVIRSDGKDPEVVQAFELLRKHSNVLREKKEFLETMLGQTQAKPSWSSQRTSGDRKRSVGSMGMHDETIHIPETTEFESEFNNRFVIHNMQLKWNNLLRNIVLRYFHQNSQRRGFIYYLSRPAIKFILDIVEEQNKAKANGNPKSTHTGHGGTSSKNPSIDESDTPQDIKDRIKKILGDGRKFTSATWSTNADGAIEGSIEDLVNGIAEEFTPQSSYHIRIVAPQIQLQSDKNKKHVVLATAKGMELKVMEVMDKERISDTVSGLVQRRFLVNMDSIQFFVTHQKWFLTNLLSMYVGSKYGTPSGSSWPPWVPIEVVFDFQADPFGFKRVVQKTSAMIRYDKYNTLRLKYNDEVNMDNPNEASQENAESRMDNLWVEFPQARALCNSSQYYALYVIVLDLLMYNEPLEKTRSERLEKIILASDFSDLSGAPAMVQKLQQRIRQMEEIKEHFQTYSKYLDKRGWEDRLHLERDLAACEDELFFMMKAITSSQRKFDVNSDSTGLLRWNISVRDIVWHLMQDSNEPLVEFQLKDLEYDRTDNSDGSHVNLIRVGKVLGLNLLPDATYPEMVAPYIDPERPLGSDTDNKEMIRVYWYMLEAIAGITVMDGFEVNVLPIKVQLEREVGKRLFEYIFPGMGEDKSGTKNDSPFMMKQMDADEEDDDSLHSTNGRSDTTSFDRDSSSSFTTRPGSLELRLHPTLTSNSKSGPSKKALSVNTGEGHSFRLFRTPGTSKTLLKKASHDSMRSGATPRAALKRTNTGYESKAESIASSEKRIPRFSLGKKQVEAKGLLQPSDDLTKMMTRASHFMTFASIKMPSVVLCLSYKGKDQRNFEDVHDFVFRMPTIEWQNKTWSNLDLALALKKAVMKALISHTGALIGNKFSKHRPNAEQRNKLRELANSSVLIAPSSSGGSQHYTGSINDSDDSSSMYGSSPVDFSRSPPRSLRAGSTHSSIPPSISSRRRSRSSSATSRRSHLNGGLGASHGPVVPTYLMMTPPTPIEDNRSTRHNHGMELLRPGTSSGHSTTPTQNHQAFRRMGTGIERPMSSMSSHEAGVRRKTGTNNLKDKISALTYRMSHRDPNDVQDDEIEVDEEVPPPREQRPRRMSWVSGRSKG